MNPQPNVLLHKAVAGLFLVPLHHRGLHVLVRSECTTIQRFPELDQRNSRTPASQYRDVRSSVRRTQPAPCATRHHHQVSSGQRHRGLGRFANTVGALTLMPGYLTSKTLHIYISEVKAAEIPPKSSCVSMEIGVRVSDHGDCYNVRYPFTFNNSCTSCV